MSFIDRHKLRTDEQRAAATAAAAAIAERGLSVVRFAFVDAHGVLRGKTVVAEEAVRLLGAGLTATTTLLLKDLSGKTAFPVYAKGGGFDLPALEGAADMVLAPDPATFRILPWAPHSGWILCDIYLPDGAPMPLSTRQVMRSALDRLAKRGLAFVAGLEVECHILKLVDPLPPGAAGQPGLPGTPPATGLINAGYQYLTEVRYDAIDPLMEVVRANLQALGLPLRSLEIEFGPSQVELTFGPTVGLEPADMMVLLRSAVKQICRRHGYHATFMCRPKIENAVSSGWHLHQSLRDVATGANIFVSDGPETLFSPAARGYLAGLLAHARGAAALSTPTINGYKRYRPYANAPDRATWACDNRGVMVRVLGGGDPATRLENRVGEPAANPYLYMTSQIHAGLDGIDRGLDPGPSADTPYETDAPALPRSLMEALEALKADACLTDGLGAFFVDYFVRLKNAEIARFLSEVTDWEQREYFDIL